jgi:hypothetical protein
VSSSVPAGWENFFVAEAGASAALAGLLFVAVSINLTRILAFPHLPGRAAEALIVLLSVLTSATFGLVPNQGAAALGAELLGTGLWVVAVASSIQWRARKHRHPQSRPLWRIATNQLPAFAFVLCGGSLLAGRSCGIYWLVPATILSFAGGVFNTWVLLVEIQR